MPIPPQRCSKYSSASRRWQCSAVGSLHSRTVLFAKLSRERTVSNFSIANEAQVGFGVLAPIAFALFECVENILGRRQQRLMLVFRAADLFQEIRQIRLLREPCQLRGIIQPHVQQALDAMRLQCAEKLSGAFLGETDAVDLHWSSSSSANNAGCSFTSFLPEEAATSASVSTRPSPRI